MKKLYISLAVLALTFFTSQAMAQGANKWYFSINLGLDFTSGTPVLINTTSPALYDNVALVGYNTESASTMTDNSGNVVFTAIPTGVGTYSVLDRNFVSKGTIATTSDAAQGSLAFPVPGSGSQYYLCTVDAMANVSGCTGFLGDLGSDRGAKWYRVTNTGSTVTVSGATTAVASGVAECQVGIPKSNGTDYWWIVHERGNNNFKVFSVTNGGISLTTTIGVGYSFAACDYVSMLVVNSCNNKIAMAIGGSVTLFDFNSTTGAITNPQQWALGCAYGLEFSTNSKYLYVATGDGGACTPAVYQYDISSGVAATIASSANNLGTTYGSTGKSGHLQLGPDGNIYLAQMSSYSAGNYAHYLGRISNITSPGAVFNNTYLAISDASNNKMAMAMGLPTILRSFITGRAQVGSTDVANLSSVCLGNAITFKVDFNNSITGYNWNVDANLNTVTDYTTASPVHTYPSAGNYLVNVTVTDFCGYKYTDTSTVKVVPNITATGTVSCGGSAPVTVTLSGTGAGSSNYIWSLPNKSVIGVGATLVRTFATATAIPAFFTIFDASTVASTITAGPTNCASCGEYDATGVRSSTFNIYQNTVLDAVTVRKAANYTDNLSTPKIGTISVLKSGVLVASRQVSINCAESVGTVNILTNLGLYIPAGTGYTLSITGYSSDYNSTNAPVNIAGLVSISGAASPFYNWQFKQTSPCTSVATISGNCPLPVSFIGVEARETNEFIELTWKTISENNNKEFQIERSSDGVNFVTIGQLAGSGNSVSRKTYSFLDKNAHKGALYYRIRQVDYDGNFTFSIVVSPDRADNVTVQLFPNPFANETTLRILSSSALEGDIKLYNVHGALVYQKTGSFSESIQLGSELAKGFYTLEIISNGYSGTHKIIKE